MVGKGYLFCRKGQVREIIMATNPTLEGDGTALYISGLLAPLGVRVTRLARGLPTGSVLEFANSQMLADAQFGKARALVSLKRGPEAEAALRYQERQTAEQIRQAESTHAAIEAQVTADLAHLILEKFTKGLDELQFEIFW